MNEAVKLKSNISVIAADGITGWKVNSKELEPIIDITVKNFFSPMGASLALEAQTLWKKYQDRESVQSLLLIAYDLEMDWRTKHPQRAWVLMLTVPHGIEKVSMTIIKALTVPSERELRTKLECLSYSDFLNTQYWKAIRLSVLQQQGFECQAEVNGIQCGAKDELQVHHKTYDHARGLEHRHQDDLTVLCERHHLLHHLQETGEPLAYKVPIKSTVGPGGAKWGGRKWF